MSKAETNKSVADGIVHKVPADMRSALLSSNTALTAWENISPLARNEWICWVESVKQQTTRAHHITRAVDELSKGKKRPCCWMGCVHRTDKPMSASQKFLTEKRSK